MFVDGCEDGSGGAGLRLGLAGGVGGGVSTLEPGQRPPSGVSGARGSMVPVTVLLLDDTQQVFHIAPGDSGKILLDQVCLFLNLLEGEYFGLEYQDHRNTMVWLNLLKPVWKQIRRSKVTILRFVVKFFPPDQNQLMDELTRYLFALQVKRDLASGLLVVNDSSAALMVSHIIQSELGDFEETTSFQHLLHNKYFPDQDAIRDQITACHRGNVGCSPGDSDYHLLEVARKSETFGVRLSPARDRDGVWINLAAVSTGILVLQGSTRINSFNWSRIRKLSFKRKRFLIKLRPDPQQSGPPHQDTLEFNMWSRDSCKAFWKVCVEHHAFFRLLEEPPPLPRPLLLSRGSSFRFSGRTHRQLVERLRGAEPRAVPFQRKHSRGPSGSDSGRQVASTIPLPEHVEAVVTATSHDNGNSPGNLGSDNSLQASPAHVPVSNPANSLASIPASKATNVLASIAISDLANIPDSIPSSDPANVPVSMLSNIPGSDLPNVPASMPGSVLASDLSPLTSPLLTGGGYVYDNEDEEEARRKKFPTDKTYFIAKELLMTERTFLKELQVITQWLPVAVAMDQSFPDSLKSLISSCFDPIFDLHQRFLKEAEQRLALWEGGSKAHIKGDFQRIGDVFLKNIQGIKQLKLTLQKLPECLFRLDSIRRQSLACRRLELQPRCFLPLNVFLLRPLQRLLHYRLLLEPLCKLQQPSQPDFRDCRAALAEVSELLQQLDVAMETMENFQRLVEIEEELEPGVQDLLSPCREFIRLGCLSKLSRKGLQQRMFFLFSDRLIYCSRGISTTNQFKVHGQLTLYGMTIRESEEEWGVPHSFTLISQRQTVVVAASCASEMQLWLDDIKMAIDLAQHGNLVAVGNEQQQYKQSEDRGGGGGRAGDQESEEELSGSRSSLERHGYRGNSIIQVCWHRNTSVSMVDFSIAVENQLSGNLLRKFKNSNGWQKLWVVFTNFSLFFYKSHEDDAPLASLPLLGYSVSVPSESDEVRKDYVFKLRFKSHVYFFRCESHYAFLRWMEVIRSATCSASR